MARALVFCILTLALLYVSGRNTEVSAVSKRAVVVVSESFWQRGQNWGRIVQLDETGAKTEVAVLDPGRPGPLKFDKEGNLFVLSHEPDEILRIAPGGAVSTFASKLPVGSLNDLEIASDGTLYLLVYDDVAAEVWHIRPGDSHQLVATTENIFPVQGARSLTFGPEGDLYLATQGGEIGGRILRMTRGGNVSLYFDPGLSAGRNFIDMRFDSNGDMLILARDYTVPNGRIIYKMRDGTLAPFVPAANLRPESLQLTIDARDNLYISGGGFTERGPEGAVEMVDPTGSVTTLATFSGGSAISDIDDFAFDMAPADVRSTPETSPPAQSPTPEPTSTDRCTSSPSDSPSPSPPTPESPVGSESIAPTDTPVAPLPPPIPPSPPTTEPAKAVPSTPSLAGTPTESPQLPPSPLETSCPEASSEDIPAEEEVSLNVGRLAAVSGVLAGAVVGVSALAMTLRTRRRP